MIKKWLSVLLLLTLFGCGQDKSEWNPVFEETDFDYLNINVERALSLIDEVNGEANGQAENLNGAQIQEKLGAARSRLLEIKDYYIPLTTVRQDIYDADRYFKLKKNDRAQDLLGQSKSIIQALQKTTQNKVFDKIILELDAMIDGVVISMEKDSQSNTTKKMKQLGEHVNLMLSRGELVLSGIEFER